MTVRAAFLFAACIALLGACNASPIPTASASATPTTNPTAATTATASAVPTPGPTSPPPTAIPTSAASPSAQVSELGTGGNVFPGTYHTQLDPGLTLTIDRVVDLDCAPGYKCRGDIDVNQDNWVGFEFGNINGSQFDVVRIDKVFDPAAASKVIDPPSDLGAWLAAFPGLDVLVAPTPASVGGVSGTQLDVQSPDDLGLGPSWGLAAGHRNRITLLWVDGHAVLINEQLGPDNTVGDFDTAMQGLEPLVQSIVWETPTPSATPAQVPDALRYYWVGETRSIPGLTPPAVESNMKIDETGLTFHATEDWAHPLITSAVSIDPAGDVVLTLGVSSTGCIKGDVGTYAFNLSPSGRALDIEVRQDPCAMRAAALSGDWTRADCSENHLCLGDLDAGHHVSVIYTPFVRFTDHQYDYGRFGYTVPDGWTNPEDNPDGYVLLEQNGPEDAGIYLFSDVLAHSQAVGCPSEAAPGVGTSATAIHDWINSLPGLDVSNDASVQIGDLTGFTLDLALKPTWDVTCPWDDTAAVPLFVNAQSTPEEGFDWGIGGDGRMRLFVLDLAPDRTLLVDIEAQDSATWDALLIAAMPIVKSFQFKH